MAKIKKAVINYLSTGSKQNDRLLLTLAIASTIVGILTIIVAQ